MYLAYIIHKRELLPERWTLCLKCAIKILIFLTQIIQ